MRGSAAARDGGARDRARARKNAKTTGQHRIDQLREERAQLRREGGDPSRALRIRQIGDQLTDAYEEKREHLVETICTTNTAWSGTRKMTAALVDNLGVEAPDGAHAFPTADAMAAEDEAFYREVVRAGYRGQYLKQLASDVAASTSSR